MDGAENVTSIHHTMEELAFAIMDGTEHTKNVINAMIAVENAQDLVPTNA